MQGKFTVKKSTRSFSAISFDQSHEQLNRLVKDDGGAIGLTENEAALRRWMTCGPEIARLIAEFQETNNCSDKPQSHDEQRHKSCIMNRQIRVKKNYWYS